MKAGDLVYLSPWLQEQYGDGLWVIMRVQPHGRLGQEAYKVHCVTTGEQRVFHYTNLYKADTYCPGLFT
jgi:hypothetical protein